MYSVTVREHCMIAHSLPDPFFGPAANLHGATYIVDAEFSSLELNDHNVVIDIGAAHMALKNVISVIDYKNLDDLELFRGKLTTTEFIAHYIHHALAEAVRGIFKGNLKIRLGESHVAWASYEGTVY